MQPIAHGTAWVVGFFKRFDYDVKLSSSSNYCTSQHMHHLRCPLVFFLVSFKILLKGTVLASLLRSVKAQGKNPQGMFYEMVRHGLSGF